MDEDERKKKLLAGKQKLAAFRKKRSRRKKAKNPDDTHSDLSDATLSDASSVVDLSDVDSLSYDEESATDGEYDPALAKSDRRLKDATDRVIQLEESIVGKQTALERLVEENETLKQQLNIANTLPMKQTESSDPGTQTGPGPRADEASAELYSLKLKEFEAELTQRDTVIKQLSEKLQATVENRDLLQAEYVEQAAQLSGQVQLLQQQLKQTSEWLKTESGGRGISAQALLEAKNELIALQQINRHNEDELLVLRQAVAQRDQALLQRDQSLHQIAEKMTYVTNYCKLLESEKETFLKTARSSSVAGEGETSQLGEVEEANRLLRQREKENTEVVRRLMTDIEELKKGGAIAGTKVTGDVINMEDHRSQVAALRAELDETYGLQIGAMKQELVQRQEADMVQLKRDLMTVATERDQLSQQLTQLSQQATQLSQQATHWHGMYTELTSQDGLSQLEQLRTENHQYKQLIVQLNAQVEMYSRTAESTQVKPSQPTQRGEDIGGKGSGSREVDLTEIRRTLGATQQEVERLKAQRDTVIEQYEGALRAVRDDHARSLGVLKEALLADHNRELDKVKSSHSAVLDTMRAKMDQLRGDKLAADRTVTAMTARHLLDIELTLQQRMVNSTPHKGERSTTGMTEITDVLEHGAAHSVVDQHQGVLQQQDDMDSLKTRLQEVTRQLTTLTSELEASQEESRVMSSELERSRTERDEYQSKLDSDLGHWKLSYSKVDSELDQLRQERMAVLKKMEDLVAEGDSMRSHGWLTVEYDSVASKLACLQVQHTDALGRIERLITEKDALEMNLSLALDTSRSECLNITAQLERMQGTDAITAPLVTLPADMSRVSDDGDISGISQGTSVVTGDTVSDISGDASELRMTAVAELQKFKEKHSLELAMVRQQLEDSQQHLVALRQNAAHLINEMSAQVDRTQAQDADMASLRQNIVSNIVALHAMFVADTQHDIDPHSVSGEKLVDNGVNVGGGDVTVSVEQERPRGTVQGSRGDFKEGRGDRASPEPSETERLQAEVCHLTGLLAAVEEHSHLATQPTQGRSAVGDSGDEGRVIRSTPQTDLHQKVLELEQRLEKTTSENSLVVQRLTSQVTDLQALLGHAEDEKIQKCAEIQALQAQLETERQRFQSEGERLQTEKLQAQLMALGEEGDRLATQTKLEVDCLKTHVSELENKITELGLSNQTETQKHAAAMMQLQQEQLQQLEQLSQQLEHSQQNVEKVDGEKLAQTQEMERREQLIQQLKEEKEHLLEDLNTSLLSSQEERNELMRQVELMTDEKKSLISAYETELERSKQQLDAQVEQVRAQLQSESQLSGAEQAMLLQSMKEDFMKTENELRSEVSQLQVEAEAAATRLMETTAESDSLIQQLRTDKDSVSMEHADIVKMLVEGQIADLCKEKDSLLMEHAEIVRRLQMQVEDKEKEGESLQREHSETVNSLQRHIGELETSRDCMVIEHEETSRTQQAQIEDLQNCKTSLLADKTDIVGALQTQIEELQRTRETLVGKLGETESQLQSQITELQQGRATVLAEHADTVGRLQRHIEELQMRGDSVTTKHADSVRTHQLQVETLQKSRDSLLSEQEQTVKTLQAQVEELRKSRDSLLSEHEQTVKTLQAQVEELRKSRDSLLGEHEQTVKALQAEIDELQRNRYSVMTEHTETVKRLKAEIGELHKNRNSMATENTETMKTLQAQIEEFQKSRDSVAVENTENVNILQAQIQEFLVNMESQTTENTEHVKILQAQIQELLKNRESLITENTENVRILQTQIQELQKSRDSLMAENTETVKLLQVQVEELQKSRDSLMTENTETVKSSQAQIQELLVNRESLVTESTENVKTLQAQIQVLQKSRDSLVAENTETVKILQAQIEELQKSRDSLATENTKKTKALQAQFEEVQKSRDSLITENAETVKTLQAQVEELQKSRDSLAVENTETVKTLWAQTEELQKSRDSLASENAETIKTLQTQVEELQNSRDSLASENAKTIKTLQAEIEELQKSQDSMRSEHIETANMQQSRGEELEEGRDSVNGVSLSAHWADTSRDVIAAPANHVEIGHVEVVRDLVDTGSHTVQGDGDNLQHDSDVLQHGIDMYGEDTSPSQGAALGSSDVIMLQRQLAAMKEEREAMKETFEDDLQRMTEQVAEKESERLHLEQDVTRLEALLHGTMTQPMQDVTMSPDADTLDADTTLPPGTLLPTGDSVTSLPPTDSVTQLTSDDHVTASLSGDCVSPLQLVSALQTQLQSDFDAKLHELQRTAVDSDQLEAAVTTLQIQYQKLQEARDELVQQIDMQYHQQRALQEENEWLRHDLKQLLQAKQGGMEEGTSGRSEEEKNVGEEFLGRILQQSQLRDQNQLLLFQGELSSMCVKYNKAVGCHRTLYEKLLNNGVVSDTDYDSLDEIPMSSIPQLTQTLPGGDSRTDMSSGVSYTNDSTDWKLKYESLRRDIDVLQLQHALSPRASQASPTHMDWKSMYTSIAEENETLRAKLGQFGLPTECPPEEDYVHLGTQYDIAIQENEMLRAQVTACENHQMAAQCAVRQTVESEYRLTTLDSTDESVTEYLQEVSHVDGVEDISAEATTGIRPTDTAVGDATGSFVSPRCSDSSHTLVGSPQRHGDVTDGRIVSPHHLQETHTTLVTEHARLKERFSELESRCELLALECSELQKKSAVYTKHEADEAAMCDLHEEADGLRMQLAATGSLQEEVEGLRRQLAATGSLQEEAMGLRKQLDAAKENKEGQAIVPSGREVEDIRDQHHGRQEERKQQSAVKETSLEDSYNALMETHEALKKEFEMAQSKAKKDFTKMKAKAVAATRLAEGLKEQLRAAELAADANVSHPEASDHQVSDPTNNSSEQLEELKKRLSVLSEEYQETGEELKAAKDERDRCKEEIEQQKTTIASLYQENGLLQERVTDAAAKINEVVTQRQREYTLVVEENERVVFELKAAAVERENIGKEVEALRKRSEEVFEEMNTWRLNCEALQKEMLQLQEQARIETENQESCAENNVKLRLELQSVCEEKTQLLVELQTLQTDSDVNRQLEKLLVVERENCGGLQAQLTEREEQLRQLVGVSEQLASVVEENKGVHQQLIEMNEQREDMKTQLINHEQQVKELEATKAELDSTKIELESTNAKLESANAELESTYAELESTNAELESTNTKLESTNTKLESTNAELESTKVELESTNTNLESANSQLKSTNADLESTKGKLEPMNGQLESTKVELGSANLELESTKVELESTKGELESTNAQLESTTAQLESLHQENTALHAQLAENQPTKLEHLQKCEDTLHEDSLGDDRRSPIIDSGQQVVSVPPENNNLDSVSIDQLAEMKQEFGELTKQRDTLCKENESLQETNKSLQKKNKSLQEKSDSLCGENESLQEKYNSLQETNNSLQETNDSLQGTNGSLQETNNSLHEKNQCLCGENENLQETNKSLCGDNDSLQETNQILQKKNESLCGENESLRGKNKSLSGENEGLRVQLIDITDKVEEQVEKMQAAYAAVVEENDNNLVEVKRLSTQLTAAETRYHQLQTQSTSDTGDMNREDTVKENENCRLSEELARVAVLQQNDQTKLLQVEAEYKTLSEEHKALVATSSSRQREVEQLEKRLRRLHADEMEEREKELEDMRKERATEKEWFDAELQDWQCRYDALHQESRQLKKVLSSGTSDTLTHEFLGLQRRYEQVVDEQRVLQCTADEHKASASAAQTRVHELEACVAHLEHLQQADASPVSVGEIRHNDKERLHAETAGGDRPLLVFSCADVDLGGVDLAGVNPSRDHGGEDHGDSQAQGRGDHSQTGVTISLKDPSNFASHVCFDASSDGSGGGSSVPASELSMPDDTGGSTGLLVVTDGVSSDRTASDTSGDTPCCDDLIQISDTRMTQKGADDQGRMTPTQSKVKATSKKCTTEKTSSRKQTVQTDKHLSEGTTKRKPVKGPVKSRVTPKVKQSGKGDTRQNKTTERELKASANATTSSNSVSEIATLKLNNESLRKENQMLCEKAKRSFAKAAEDLVKTKRLYENALREKKELEMKISVQRLSSDHKTKMSESPRPRHDEKALSKELNKLKKEKAQLERQLAEMRSKGVVKPRVANRDAEVTLEHRATAGSREEDMRRTGQGDWPDVVCVHCEILLAEKNDLCLKFDCERAQLKEEIEGLTLRVSMSQTQETDFLTRKNRALADQLRSVKGQLEQCSLEGVNPLGGRHQVAQLSRQLSDVTVVNAALQKEATELRRQLGVALVVTRQPGDGSSCTSNTPLTHTSPVVQRDTAVTPPTVLMTSFGDDPELSQARSKSPCMSSGCQSISGGRQSMSGSHQSMTQLSHAELLLQYEILLQEKRELCVRLDEKVTENEELAERLSEAQTAVERTQEEPPASPAEGRVDNNRPEMTTDTDCEKCKQLKTENTHLDDKFLKLQVLHNTALAECTQLVVEVEHYKTVTAECSSHSEALQMAHVECEKLTQDIARLLEEQDRVASERHQLECKLEDLTFRNDELVAVLETSGSAEMLSADKTTVDLRSADIDGATVQARLDTCERQCKLLNTENFALVKELQQCRKDLELVEEQLRSLESEKSLVDRDLEECLSSKARLCGQLIKTGGGGCLREQQREPDVDKEREGQDTDQTDTGSVSDVQMNMHMCLIQRESHVKRDDDSADSQTTQDMASQEICRLTDEVENWRRLNSDISRVCECLDSRVAGLSAQVEQLSVVNRDLRAENAALVFDREDWTSGSEDRDVLETEQQGDVNSWTQKYSANPQTSDGGFMEETESGQPLSQDGKKDGRGRGASFGPVQGKGDFSGMLQMARQAESRLEQDVTREVGDMAALGDTSWVKDIMKCGDSNCDETDVIDDVLRIGNGEMKSTDEEKSLVAREYQLKDDRIRRLETQLHRQQFDIQKAALEYKLLISLLSEVTSLQQHSDTDDTHRQRDMSVSACLVDGLPVYSMASLQQIETVSTVSPEELRCKGQSSEMSCSEELREKADRLEMTVSQLTAENVSLSERCRQQESVISQLRHQVSVIDDGVSGDMTLSSDVAEKQITLLQKQRNEIQHQVTALKEQSQKLASALCERSTLERKLSTELTRCEQLNEEKQLLEQELLQERVALGRHIREQHREQHRLLQQVAALQAGSNVGEGDGSSSGKVGKMDRVHRQRVVGKGVTCYPLRGGACGKVRLRCGCSVEAGGRKMHAHCEYHRAIERLRAALAHTNAKKRQQVAAVIPSSVYPCDYVS